MKTSELTGTALDWAVAKCMAVKWKPPSRPYRCSDCIHYEERQGRDEAIQYCHHPEMDFNDGSDGDSWASDFERHKKCPYKTEVQTPTYPAYSTDWSQGGPIIERELIDLFSIASGSGWCAQSGVRVFNGYGPTALIAAMRCYVASRLGDEIELPKG